MNTERERDQIKEAGNVSIELRGGAGYGTPPNQMMTNFHIVIRNLAMYDAVMTCVTLDSALRPLGPLRTSIRIRPGDEHSELVQVEDVPASNRALLASIHRSALSERRR